MSTAKTTSPNQFPRLLIAHVEGTARSVRHRQNQFRQLHPALVKHRSSLVQALKDDHGYSETEALFEYSLVLSELRGHYESLNLEQEVQAAKAIENANESLTRYVGAGIVYIVPRSGLHSVLSPLFAAIAAGNCVIVELPQTTNRTSSALRNILLETLNLDTFAISKGRPDSEFLKQCTTVLQSDEVLRSSSKEATDLLSCKRLIASPSSASNFSIVDRTADIKLAARCLIVAKFGFGGLSPYAPDVVFVHEAVAKSFAATLVELANSILSGLNSPTQAQRLGPSEKELAALKDTAGTKVLLSGRRGVIIEVFDGLEKALSSFRKLSSRSSTMLICRVTSSDEAIDLAVEPSGNGNMLPTQNPAGAIVFANPADAQYLANGVDASYTCVNTLPTELLVGPKLVTPATLAGGQVSLSPRYSRQMFEEPRPSVQSQSTLSRSLDDGVNLVTQSENQKFKQWVDGVQSPLKPTGQRLGKAVGFFDAAIMLAAATTGVPVLVGLGFLGSLAMRKYGVKINLPW